MSYNPQIPKPDPKTTEAILAIIYGPEEGMNDALVKFQNPIGNLKSTLLDIIETIKFAWAHVVILRDEKQASAADIEALNVTKQALQTEILGLQGMLDNKKEVMEKEYGEFLKTKNEEIRIAESKLAQAISERNAEEAKKLALLGVITDLDTRRNEILDDIGVKQRDLTKYSNDLEQIKVNHTSAKENHVSLSKTISALNESAAARSKDISGMEKKISSLNLSINSLVTEIAGLDKHKQELEATVDGIEKRAFIVTEREKTVNQRKVYIQKLYEKAGIFYPRDPTDTGPYQK